MIEDNFSLILNARSVIHGSGRVFDRVRERETSSTSQLEEAARAVTESLRKTLATLPDNIAIDQAVSKKEKWGNLNQKW